MFLELCSHTSQNRHGCRFRSNAYKDVCLLRWRTYRKPISEFLEHLASYNGADMHKYNTLYTCTLSWHVLAPTSCNCTTKHSLSSHILRRPADFPEFIKLPQEHIDDLGCKLLSALCFNFLLHFFKRPRFFIWSF